MQLEMNESRPSDNPPADDTPIDDELNREVAESLADPALNQMMLDAMTTGAGEDPETSSSEEGTERQESADENQPGFQIKRGRINSIQSEDVFVDLVGVDQKLQGVVPLKQFDRSPRVGSVMDFVVERIDEGEGLICLSREGAVTQSTWQQLARGAIVEARVVSTNKGGLELEMVGGIRAFMPASQIDLVRVDSLENFIGEKMNGMVQEIDRRSRNVVLSRRRLLQHERQKQRQKTLEELEVDQTRNGKVSNIMPYGVFVDLGGVDGLVHVSDLSYTHVKQPSDVVTVGQEVTVKILQIDEENQKIRLGLKQVGPDPWEGIEGQVHVGDVVTGRIVRTAEFGAFVEIQAGVEGLLPVSEISWKRIGSPAEVVKPEDLIQVKVLQLDTGKRRMSLSLKQVQGDPWTATADKYPRHSTVEGTVVRTTQFGAFVELEPGIEGLVHISELSDTRVSDVNKVVQVGQKYEFRILEVSESDRRMKLSRKALLQSSQEIADSAVSPRPTRTARPRSGKPLNGGLGGGGGMGQGLGDLKL